MFNLPNLRFTWGGLHGDVSCNLSTLARVGGGRLNECKSNEGICGEHKSHYSQYCYGDYSLNFFGQHYLYGFSAQSPNVHIHRLEAFKLKLNSNSRNLPFKKLWRRNIAVQGRDSCWSQFIICDLGRKLCYFIFTYGRNCLCNSVWLTKNEVIA